MCPHTAHAPAEPPVPETPEKRKARIEGIKKLIQQASSPIRAEAEQAAYRACALIRKFGLDVVDPSLVNELHAENHRLKLQLEEADESSDPIFATPRTQAQTASPFQRWSTSTQASPFANTPPWQQAPPQQAPAPGAVTPIFVASLKFAGKCRQCGKALDAGEPGLWVKSITGVLVGGVWCAGTPCFPTWQQNQQAGVTFNPFP